jgi:DNA-binding IclR family transcriptional regulator
MAHKTGGREPVPHSQTLDRGLRFLEILAEAGRPLSVSELAARLAVHRSIAYRILRTLEDHRLVARDSDGRCALGVGISMLAGSVRPSLQAASLPELSALANDLGMTAFLAVEDRGEAVTLLSIEPSRSAVHVSYRPGTRHPIDRGAPGIALLLGGPPHPGEPPEVAEARARGWAHTQAEILPGTNTVAMPLVDRSHRVVASVGVVYVDHGEHQEAVASRILTALHGIQRELP